MNEGHIIQVDRAIMEGRSVVAREPLFQIPLRSGIYDTRYGQIGLTVGPTDGQGLTKLVFQGKVTRRVDSERRIVRIFQDKETHHDRGQHERLIFRRMRGR